MMRQPTRTLPVEPIARSNANGLVPNGTRMLSNRMLSNRTLSNRIQLNASMCAIPSTVFHQFKRWKAPNYFWLLSFTCAFQLSPSLGAVLTFLEHL